MVWGEKGIAEEPIAPECGHHWVIEPADGPFCKTFTNYIVRHDVCAMVGSIIRIPFSLDLAAD